MGVLLAQWLPPGLIITRQRSRCQVAALFTQFDAAADRNHVHKVETIGDVRSAEAHAQQYYAHCSAFPALDRLIPRLFYFANLFRRTSAALGRQNRMTQSSKRFAS